VLSNEPKVIIIRCP